MQMRTSANYEICIVEQSLTIGLWWLLIFFYGMDCSNYQVNLSCFDSVCGKAVFIISYLSCECCFASEFLTL